MIQVCPVFFGTPGILPDTQYSVTRQKKDKARTRQAQRQPHRIIHTIHRTKPTEPSQTRRAYTTNPLNL